MHSAILRKKIQFRIQIKKLKNNVCELNYEFELYFRELNIPRLIFKKSEWEPHCGHIDRIVDKSYCLTV